jgi:hypothetical protein
MGKQLRENSPSPDLWSPWSPLDWSLGLGGLASAHQRRSHFAGITWGKVVSLYAVAAGLAVDCVRQAQPAMVHALVDCLGEFVRKTLATWLRRRGGWVRPECVHMPGWNEVGQLSTAAGAEGRTPGTQGKGFGVQVNTGLIPAAWIPR